MAVDPRSFHRLNMVDTCAVWNVLSSTRLYESAISARCTFSCTRFVIYECLLKPRKKIDKHERELQKRLVAEREKGRFQMYSLDIEDLQEVEILEKRKKLGKGELSSIAFAKRTWQAFLTDDQKARKLALEVMPSYVQTTPHLFGWLLYEGVLKDRDTASVVSQHEELNLQLGKYFNEIVVEWPKRLSQTASVPGFCITRPWR